MTHQLSYVFSVFPLPEVKITGNSYQQLASKMVILSIKITLFIYMYRRWLLEFFDSNAMPAVLGIPLLYVHRVMLARFRHIPKPYNSQLRSPSIHATSGLT